MRHCHNSEPAFGMSWKIHSWQSPSFVEVSYNELPLKVILRVSLSLKWAINTHFIKQ